MKKMMSGVIAIVLVGVVSVGVEAKSKHHGDERGVLRLASELNLSEDQMAQLKVAFEEARQGLDRQADKDSVRDLDPTSKDYEQKVEALADKAASLAREKVLRKADLHKKVDAILTDEQQQKLKTLKAERHDRMLQRKQDRIDRAEKRLEKEK